VKSDTKPNFIHSHTDHSLLTLLHLFQFVIDADPAFDFPSNTIEVTLVPDGVIILPGVNGSAGMVTLPKLAVRMGRQPMQSLIRVFTLLP
jgi:hypothetical protein